MPSLKWRDIHSDGTVLEADSPCVATVHDADLGGDSVTNSFAQFRIVRKHNPGKVQNKYEYRLRHDVEIQCSKQMMASFGALLAAKNACEDYAEQIAGEMAREKST